MEENTTKSTKFYHLIIIDESGSMHHLREVTMSGVNEVLGTIRSTQESATDGQKHFVTLVTFDLRGDEPPVRTLIDNQPIAEVGEFTNYQPMGCTPLYDAMGLSINRLKALVGDDIKSAVSVTVLTDGLENASREWSGKKLKELIVGLKEQGWSFSYMGSAHDVKEVTDLLSIDNIVEFTHDVQGTRSSFRREASSKLRWMNRMSSMIDSCSNADASPSEVREAKRAVSRSYYVNRNTPDPIDTLGADDVFVFGSNDREAAARAANFGATGVGEGLQGQCYVIPTDGSAGDLEKAIMRFTDYAAAHGDKRFLVTRIDRGTDALNASGVAQLFSDAILVPNICLPREYWKMLGVATKFDDLNI